MTTDPLSFTTDPACRACPLWRQALTVCVPSVCWHRGGEDALLVLGQNPGAEEDRNGVPFIGPAGRVLKRVYLEPFLRSGLNPTVFLSNPVRCGPGSPPPDLSIRTCYPLYTAPELDRILQKYRRVAVLCTGAVAVKAITGNKLGSQWTLSEAFNRQGVPLNDRCSIFFTYHPAAVLRKRTLGHPVADHLELLRKWFLAASPVVSQPNIVRPRPPCTKPSLSH
jgi:DNA polymerase